MSSKKSIITLTNICKTYRQGPALVPVLNDLSIAFEQGNSYAITGISGSGKSTLLHVIAALDQPSSGTLLYDSCMYAHMNEADLAELRTNTFGLLFQVPHLIAELSAEENVIIPGLIAGRSYNNCLPRSRELLEHLGLADRMAHKPFQLSGGQQQRVALARALFNKPKFIIADEPTSNLDPHTGKQIIDLLVSCKNEWGMGVIISSHDRYVSECMEIIYELRDGRIARIK